MGVIHCLDVSVLAGDYAVAAVAGGAVARGPSGWHGGPPGAPNTVVSVYVRELEGMTTNQYSKH